MRLVSHGRRGPAALLMPLLVGALLVVTPARARAQGMPGGEKHMTTMDMDRESRVFVLADLLEYIPNGTGAVRLDGLSWIGGDFNRLYLRVDGEQPFKGPEGQTSVDVMYGRLATPFWTALVGGRVELRGLGSSRRNTRTLLALGFEGMSTYFFAVEPTLYVSEKGQLSGRFATAVDLLFTQRLILEPRAELNAALQAVPELGVGAGLNDIELGGRLRYEIRREFAPYVGLRWFRKASGAAGLAREAGDRVSESGLVFGVRLWR